MITHYFWYAQTDLVTFSLTIFLLKQSSSLRYRIMSDESHPQLLTDKYLRYFCEYHTFLA